MLFGDNITVATNLVDIVEKPVKETKRHSALCRVNRDSSTLVAVRKDASQDAAISTYLNGGTIVDKVTPFDETNGYTKVDMGANGEGWIKSSLLTEV